MPAVRAMLMLAVREEISRGLAEGLPFKEIGLRLGRDCSVISRGGGRHGGRERYRAAAADSAACAGRERPKLFAVERSPRLRAVVCQQLRDGWSPASIAGRLPTEYAADESCRVSHEAIYQWVYAQPVSTLAKELISLRTGRKARTGGRRPPPAPRIREPVYIDDRPAGRSRRGRRRRSWCARACGSPNAPTASSRPAQIRDTSDLEIPASMPRAATRSSTERVETPCT